MELGNPPSGAYTAVPSRTSAFLDATHVAIRITGIQGLVVINIYRVAGELPGFLGGRCDNLFGTRSGSGTPHCMGSFSSRRGCYCR